MSDPTLKRASKDVAAPLGEDGQHTVEQMMSLMQHKDCPEVFDSLSAPMIGKQHNIVMMSMKLRNSHLRNVPEESQFTYGQKVILMINPKVHPEPHATESW